MNLFQNFSLEKKKKSKEKSRFLYRSALIYYFFLFYCNSSEGPESSKNEK